MLGLTQPADAFSLKVPDFLKAALAKLQANPMQGLAQIDGGTFMPPSPTSSPTPPPPSPSQPAPTPPQATTPVPAPINQQPNSPSSIQSQPPTPLPSPSGMNQNPQPYQPQTGQYPQPGQMMQNQPPYPMNNPQGNQMMRPGMQNQAGQYQNMGPQNDPYMRDIRNGADQMNRDLNKFDYTLKDAQRNGVKPEQEVLDAANRVRSQTQKLQNARRPEDLMGIDSNALEQDMQSLEQSKRSTQEQTRRIKDMQRGTLQMSNGVIQFEAQIKKLQKQGIGIPQETTDALQKAKTITETIKNSKDADEIESAMQDLQEVQGTLNDSRQNLEMLSRWPQTLKQLDQEIKRINTELKKNKKKVDQLMKKGFTNITTVYGQIETEVNTLKTTRDAAVEKAKSGEVQAAFELLESDFFDKTQEIWEQFRVIQTIGNLGRFASEFKKGLAKGKREIANLKKQKKDVAELQALFDQIQTKGAEVTNLLKASAESLDEDAIMDTIQELESMKQQFDSLRNDLGGGELRPWQSGGQQFNELGTPSRFQQPMKQQKNQLAPQTSGGVNSQASGQQ